MCTIWINTLHSKGRVEGASPGLSYLTWQQREEVEKKHEGEYMSAFFLTEVSRKLNFLEEVLSSISDCYKG